MPKRRAAAQDDSPASQRRAVVAARIVPASGSAEPGSGSSGFGWSSLLSGLPGEVDEEDHEGWVERLFGNEGRNCTSPPGVPTLLAIEAALPSPVAKHGKSATRNSRGGGRRSAAAASAAAASAAAPGVAPTAGSSSQLRPSVPPPSSSSFQASTSQAPMVSATPYPLRCRGHACSHRRVFCADGCGGRASDGGDDQQGA